jgi:hypothetical protein
MVYGIPRFTIIDTIIQTNYINDAYFLTRLEHKKVRKMRVAT